MRKRMAEMLLMRPVDTARPLGVLIKALKIYERAGIIVPRWTGRGWRLYSAADLDRLSQALAFKRMGFALSQICGVLDAAAGEVAAALSAQEMDFERRRIVLEDALAAVREASPRLRLVA